MRAQLMEHVTLVMNCAAEYSATFDIYSYLWTDDRHEFMRQFLLYNHVLTAEEIEAYAEDGMPESPPSLKQFRDQVSTAGHAVTAYGVFDYRIRIHIHSETSIGRFNLKY